MSEAQIKNGKDINLNGIELKLMIWDFAGQERFRYMFPQYINGTIGGILMYDITNYSSFSDIRNWVSLIHETTQRFPIILVGSKLDLDNLREVPHKEGLRVAKSIGLRGFIECSSKTGENVEVLFEAMLRLMLNNLVVNKPELISIGSS